MFCNIIIAEVEVELEEIEEAAVVGMEDPEEGEMIDEEEVAVATHPEVEGEEGVMAEVAEGVAWPMDLENEIKTGLERT